MKSARLLSLLLLLQTRTPTPVPAQTLATRLEVSVRTIYRDIEALSAAGVPVYTERGRHGGITLLPDYRTDVTGLTADESRALFILAAQGAHTALGLDAAIGSALRKVMAALPAPHRPAAELTSRRILVESSRWMGPPPREVDMSALQDAVFADRRLRIRYRHSGADAPRTYTVDPYGLVCKAGVWYLVADRRRVPRLFRADRMHAVTPTDAPVQRRDGVELADVWATLKQRVETRPGGVDVTARVRRTRFDLFLRLCGASLVEHPEDPEHPEHPEHPEGPEGPEGDGAGEWITVRLGYDALGAVRSLAPFADHVEVLEPPAAREELARCAAALTALYTEDGPPRP
ncbi:helix-turn-helix transcriptional regulator [Streptomyces sp. NPDC049813]|uniref:helix-turn-helix transcriptional regulator n=1 Tax=Streptomyces sp. NPDC049813 TaxID=3365597 RepID=UPI0037AB98B9